MKKRSNLIHSESGQILIFVIVIMMLAVLIIPAILGLTYSSAQTTNIRTERMQVLYGADTGIEDALYTLDKLGDGTNPTKVPDNINDPPVTYYLPGYTNESKVKVTIDKDGNSTYLITSTGTNTRNRKVTVQAHVKLALKQIPVGPIYVPGEGNVSTSPFDYAMASLGPTGPDFGGKAITITGDVFSNGPVNFVSGSTVQSDGNHTGNVWSGGTVTVANGVNIAGSVHSGGNIIMQGTASIGISAYAAGSIQATGAASWIQDSAGAYGAINVQNGSGIGHSTVADGDIHVSGPLSGWGFNVGGNVASNHNITVDNNGKIIGNAAAGGMVITNSGGSVSGTTTQGATQFTLTLPPIPTLVAQDVAYWQKYWGDMAKATGNIKTVSQTVGSGNLGPVYIQGDLTISNQATVQLTGTVYVTGNVEVGTKAKIKGPGEIVAEGKIHDNPNCTYGAPGQLVLLMSLSTLPGAIDLQGSDVQGAMNCVFYAPYGGVSIKNHTTMFGAMIGQTIYSHNGNSITWTQDVYSIPGLPGGNVTQGNGTWIPVEQPPLIEYTGVHIDFYRVCDDETCS